jgi:hypothetical protein
VWPPGARASEEPAVPTGEQEVARLELYGRERVTADVDGITRVLQTPLRFRLMPGAVRLAGQATAWLGASP